MSIRKKWKLILLGDPLVGKTSLRRRYLGYGFEDGKYQMTLGAEFSMKRLQNGSLQIWDLGGQEAFAKARTSYYQGAKGAVIIFDVSRQDTFNRVQFWIDEVVANIEYEIPMLLVANKIDLRDTVEGCLSETEILEKVMKLNKVKDINLIESSALTGENVDSIFENLIQEMELFDQMIEGN